MKLKRSLYTYTDSSNKKRIAKIEKIFSGSKIGKKEKEESEALILYKNGDKFYNENVHGT